MNVGKKSVIADERAGFSADGPRFPGRRCPCDAAGIRQVCRPPSECSKASSLPPRRRLISILTRRVLLAYAGRVATIALLAELSHFIRLSLRSKSSGPDRAGSRSVARQSERRQRELQTPAAAVFRASAGRGRGGEGRRAEHMAGHVRMRGRRGRWRWRLLWRRRMCILRAALQRGRRLPVTPEDAAAAEATGAVGAEAVARAEAAKAPAGVWLLLCGRCAPTCPRLHGGHLFPN
ncbi:uncharacterized protein LOC126336081 [Schistocerca gregaria]|uniref:uncharacterized protein LOC126336081 n=1 Tax=Schistocerca gregaria TaxID=7010 RepID=UPI00211DDB89|nr:uncharacterized protein LOC126336081 [Schistocerca gregaria]